MQQSVVEELLFLLLLLLLHGLCFLGLNLMIWPIFQKLPGTGMSKINFLTADVIQLLSNVKIISSKGMQQIFKKNNNWRKVYLTENCMYDRVRSGFIVNTYFMAIYVYITFITHENDVIIIVKLLYRVTSRRRVAL